MKKEVLYVLCTLSALGVTVETQGAAARVCDAPPSYVAAMAECKACGWINVPNSRYCNNCGIGLLVPPVVRREDVIEHGRGEPERAAGVSVRESNKPLSVVQWLERHPQRIFPSYYPREVLARASEGGARVRFAITQKGWNAYRDYLERDLPPCFELEDWLQWRPESFFPNFYERVLSHIVFDRDSGVRSVSMRTQETEVARRLHSIYYWATQRDRLPARRY